MPSGLRRIELVEVGGTDLIGTAEHVVGVDESGNTKDAPLVVTAVQCPRSASERLAATLVELGLNPWVRKSSSRPPGLSDAELSARVRRLLSRLERLPVTWTAVAGWGSYDVSQRAGIACTAVTKAMSGDDSGLPTYDGPAIVIHDGAPQLFGDRGLTLRRVAVDQFRGFHDRVTSVYVACLRDGDRTYPSIMAADYVSGYLSARIESAGVHGVGPSVERIDPSWGAPSDVAPTTLFAVRQRNRRRSRPALNRFAAWIDGRRPPDGNAWEGGPIRSLTRRLSSERLRQYVLTEL